MSEAKFDSHRRLCPDGACIGVIGDDGRCRVCGRSAGGGGKDAATAAPATGDAVEDEMDDWSHDAAADVGASDADDAKAAAAAGFDPNRRLCPDGDCIGVIGADGVCTVCGQKAD
jgi:hypothetical protein